MKTIVFCLIGCVTATFVRAQEVVVGAQGGFGTTWLINNNVSDQADNLDASTSFGPLLGVEAGYLFKTTSNIKLGVIVEANYAAVNQKYTGKDSLGLIVATYNFQDRLKYIQVPVLFHITGNVFFFEAGPQFSFLSGATEDFDASPSVPLFSNYTGREIRSGFKNSVTSLAFGFGGHFNVAPNLYVDARIRLAYGLTDATVDYGSSTAHDVAGEKFLLGQDYGGTAGYYANTAQKGEYSYKPTSLATGHVLVGLTYRIPTKKKE